MKIKNINDVVKNNLCIGCGLCTNFSSSKMKYNSEGFLVVDKYKHSNFEILEEDLTNKVCPGIKTYAKEVSSDNVWGDIKSLNLGYSTNNEIRRKGSSGGTITQTLVYLLEEKIVDYVIHIENHEENVLMNSVVITDNVRNIVSNTGSKYCPSSPMEEIINKINLEKKYAFVGRPCDIVALQNYCNINREFSKAIVYKISFFCAGAPSLKGTKDILFRFGVDEGNLKSFRYRGNGWPGYTTAIDLDDKEYKMSYKESWGGILKNYVNTRCKICPDGIGLSADIVFGDGWDCDKNGYPKFIEGDGKSIVITRSVNGYKLLEQMSSHDKIKLEEFNYNNLKYVQPYQYHRRTTLEYRIKAMKLFGRYTPVYEKSVKDACDIQTFKVKFKEFLGTIKRIIKKRI